MAETQKKFSRRMVALFWLLAIAVLIGVLIYFQQIAVLYVLATIGLVGLMLLVGFSDLENIEHDAAAGFTANQ